MDNIQNKSVMITGGASLIGLGFKYAQMLLRNGARGVAIIDLPTSTGKNAVSVLENEFGKDRAIFIACDVTKDDDLEKAFEAFAKVFGGLDIVINNAGMVNEIRWKQTIDVNITAVIRSSLLALDYMGKHKGGEGGVIVNIASIFGLWKSNAIPVYCASKHAVVGFSQSLADSYNKTGVRVLIMCPGITTTALLEGLKNKLANFIDPKVADQFLDNYPVQSIDNVGFAMLDLIRKGKNGAAWVSEGSQPPYAVKFTHYSKRALSVD